MRNNIIKCLHENYKNNFVNKNDYHQLMTQLQNCEDDDLKKIVLNTGTISIEELFLIIKENYNESELFYFIDEYFIQFSVTLIDDTKRVPELDPLYNQNLDIPFLRKSYPYLTNSFFEKISGAKLFIPIENNKFIQINGYFKDDPLNGFQQHNYIKHKIHSVKDTEFECPKEFSNRFLEQLPIRDWVVYKEPEINMMIKNNYNDLNKLKKKSLSELLDEFTKATPEKQRKILTLFLISDNDDQYIAHIIFDMMSNQSPYLRPFLGLDIYNTLHWSVQKLFKISLDNVEEREKRLKNLNEDDISYDKRIDLMNINNYVKTKALNKLKEMQGGKENSTKAQQYLDGLLKIPFGNFKKEPILSFLNNYYNRLSTLFERVEKRLEKYPDLIKIIEIYKKNNITTEQSVDNFIREMEEHISNYVDELRVDFSKTPKCNSPLTIEPIQQMAENISEELAERFNNDKTNIILSKKLEKAKKIKDIIKLINDNRTSAKYTITSLKEKLEEIQENNNMEEEEKDNAIYLLDHLYNLVKDWAHYKSQKVEYLQDTRKILDNCIYSHKDAKKQVERLIAQWMNGNMNGAVLGFHGPPGVGKTTLAKHGLAKCLKDENDNSRPFAYISLGGSSNGVILEGHSYTYAGSTWGRIVDILMETQCMNPIIYFDELDKVSGTDSGQEIIGILTHLTDPSQNNEYTDRYFSGIKLDLSKAIIIFSYNDPSKIDRVLRDRITEINTKALSRNDKNEITKLFLMPEILSEVGYNKEDFNITTEDLNYIIENYTYEAGVRKLKEKLYEIIRELNLRRITDGDILLPYQIDQSFIKELFQDNHRVLIKTVDNLPHIGKVNGLFATTAGTGGITIIEVSKIPSDQKLKLELTGQQGDVMKESMSCAKTVVWNLLPREIKKEITQEWDDFGPYGLHIHCPDTATAKDGPSAGLAITTAIISRLCKILVKNTVAMTGEIDLNGRSHPIGGLDSKLFGAVRAGVKLVLIPRENKPEYDKYLRDLAQYGSNNVEADIEVKLVDNIYEVLKYTLVDNDLKFNQI